VVKKSTDNPIGERLKLLRNELNLNQKQMAERLKITRAYWSALELGNRELTGNIIRVLITEFDLSADWLLGGKLKMFLHDHTSSSVDFEKKSYRYYYSLIEVIELMEKLAGPNPEFDVYLKQITEAIKKIDLGARRTKSLNFEKLSDALSEDFIELVHEYFLMTSQSERTRKLKAANFEPSRHFAKVKLDL